MDQNRVFKIGIVGTIIAAICCFTPALVFLFTMLGLSSLIGYLDIVLLPALAIFIAMAIYGYWKSRRS